MVNKFRNLTSLFSLMFLLLSINFCYADWVYTGGPRPGFVSCIAQSGTNIFAGTNGGVYLSPDSGASWTAVNNGLTDTTEVLSIVANGGNIFIGTTGINGLGIYLSTNNGANWTAVNNGLTNTDVQALAINGVNIFAGTNGGGIFISTNNGTSWTAVNNGLTDFYVLSLTLSGSNIFAGTTGGVFLSTNSGNSWSAKNIGLTDTTFVSSLAISGANIFSGTDGKGVFLSTNNGGTWDSVNVGLTDTWVACLLTSGQNIFAGTDNGIFLSTNNGASWDTVNVGLDYYDILSLSIFYGNIYAGTAGAGVWKRALWEVGIGINEHVASNSMFIVQCYPNPVSSILNVNCQLTENSEISISIIDISGREVATLLNEEKAKGEFSLKYNLDDLTRGLYFLKASANNQLRITKFIKE